MARVHNDALFVSASRAFPLTSWASPLSLSVSFFSQQQQIFNVVRGIVDKVRLKANNSRMPEVGTEIQGKEVAERQ